MKNYKPLLSLSVLGFLSTAQALSFIDVSEDYLYQEAITDLSEETVITGYSEGDFRPTNRINRAEFTTLLMRATGQTLSGENCFPDVLDQWFAPAVCTAKTQNIVAGYENGLFDPAGYINFAESAKIITKALAAQDIDNSNVENWFTPFVRTLELKKAIPVSVQTTEQYLTRGEMAEIVWRIQNEVLKKETQTYSNLTNDLPTFNSCAHLEETLKNRPVQNQYYFRAEPIMMDMMMESEAAPMAKSSVSSASGDSNAVSNKASNVSQTNVQVEGVDEADIVKNNDKYIFYLRGNKLSITDAYPAQNMKLVQELDLSVYENFNAQTMFLRENQLVVIGSVYNYGSSYGITPEPFVLGKMIMPSIQTKPVTKIITYNIEDLSSQVVQENEWNIEGNYSESRVIGDNLYLVSTNNGWWGQPQLFEKSEIIPQYSVNDGDMIPAADCTDIRFIPGQYLEQSTNITGIDLDNAKTDISTEVIMGGTAGTVYSSQDNLYIATPYWNNQWYGDWNEQEDREKTILFKFGLNDGEVEFKNKGSVPGTLLNQYSMDQNGDYFRLATTINEWNGQNNTSTNNVWVLDKTMNTVGEITDIAPGERIYSTRFMGDRLYMVTFKQVDPLFAIDLSVPSKPRILGKLKIPGYSDYLHPYDENHIIGIGKDTSFTKDRVLNEGMKLGLFDVTDPTNPIEKHSLIIGDRGTNSEVLYNPRALLWDNERKFLGFPIQIAEVPEGEEDGYGQNVFNGGIVYQVSPEKGFEEILKTTHYTEQDMLKMGDYLPYQWEKNVQRLLYMDDFLYSLSQSKIKADNLKTGKNIGEIELPRSEEDEDYPMMLE